jgi:Tfp pilus assembly protein PilN
MASVNLIPDERKINQQRHRRLRIWLVLTLIFTCTVTTWAAVKYFAYRNASQFTRNIAKQSQQIQEEIQSLKETKTQLDLWQNRYALLVELDHYVDFLKITGYLARHSPELVYLEEMDFSREDPKSGSSGASSQKLSLAKSAKMFLINNPQTDKSTGDDKSNRNQLMFMYLKGNALNYKAVADYLTVLNNSGFFYGAQLQRSGRKSDDSPGNIDFEIQCVVNPITSAMGTNYANMQQTKNL